jgi:hypothetical protein
VVTRWKVLVFITFISSIWHPWLMTKWNECLIIITIIKKWLQVIWYEHRQPYPTHPPFIYIPTYLPIHPPIYQSIFLPTHLPTTYLPTHPPMHLPTYPPMYPCTHPPTYLFTYPPTHPCTHPHTYSPTHPLTYLLIHPPTYLFNLLIFSLSTYNLPTTYLVVL